MPKTTSMTFSPAWENGSWHFFKQLNDITIIAETAICLNVFKRIFTIDYHSTALSLVWMKQFILKLLWTSNKSSQEFYKYDCPKTQPAKLTMSKYIQIKKRSNVHRIRSEIILKIYQSFLHAFLPVTVIKLNLWNWY